jgi:hypothetical protein
MLCECCIYDLFHDSEPHSVFGWYYKSL